jgi:WD40 repeat protein
MSLSGKSALKAPRRWPSGRFRGHQDRRIGYALVCAAALALDSGLPVPAAGQPIPPARKPLDSIVRTEPLLVLKGHAGEVFAVAFSPDGKLLASSSLKEVKVWDAANGRELLTFRGNNDKVYGLAFSPDGRRIASASAAGTSPEIKLWEAATAKELLTLGGHAAPIYRLAFSPDGKRLASGSGASNRPGEVRIWDTTNGRELSQLQGHTESAISVAFSPNGKRLASASGSTPGTRPGEIKVWDLDTGKEIRSCRGHSANVYAVCYSPDGRRLASASGAWGQNQPGELRLWDADSGKEVNRLGGHAGPVFCVAFSPDGRLLASGGGDRRLRLWELVTGKETATAREHAGAVYHVAFSPDGKRLASAGADKTVKLWDLTGLAGGGGPVASLAAQELASLWTDLACDEPERASRAAWRLVAVPQDSLLFLQDRLRPAAGLGPDERLRIAGLIVDLDSNEFRVRDKATRDLEQLGDAAAPALREALDAQPSLEVRRRVDGLLQKLANPVPTAERLRELRAVAVLELIGTPEARRILTNLSHGAPEARLTAEAKASLERRCKAQRP